MKNVRPNEVSINDYVVVEFESLHQIAKSHEIEVLDGAMIYRLLNNSNLPERKKQLVRTAVNNMKWRWWHHEGTVKKGSYESFFWKI